MTLSTQGGGRCNSDWCGPARDGPADRMQLIGACLHTRHLWRLLPGRSLSAGQFLWLLRCQRQRVRHMCGGSIVSRWQVR
jgi:hypothetical protein